MKNEKNRKIFFNNIKKALAFQDKGFLIEQGRVMI